ncbi:hypothetical protein Chor_003490 [Crotalus horridus]
MSCQAIIYIVKSLFISRKAALEAAIRKKIEYERKAQQVVEHLLEEDITKEFFVDCGRLITPSHYQDVVEERFIVKLCGYPLCQNKLQNVRVYALGGCSCCFFIQNVPKQKYKISTKTNKVYDITERKEIIVLVLLAVRSSVFAAIFVTKHQNTSRAKYPKLQYGFEKKKDLKLELSSAQGIKYCLQCILVQLGPPMIELLKKESSGYSGKEIQLVSERIKALDIENPTPAEILHNSDSGGESNSDAEQEFVSSVLQENLSNTEKLAGKPLKGILKKSPTKRAEPKLFTTEDTLDKTSAQLNKGTSDVLQEEHVFPDNIPGGKPCLSQNVLEKVQVSENLGNNRSCSQVVFLGVSQKGSDQFKRLLAKSKLSVRSPAESMAAKDSLLKSLRQTFTDWRSEETLKLLHGSHRTTSHLLQGTQANDPEKEELDEDDLESANSSETASQKHTFNSLDQSLPSQDARTAAKPLPSIEKLKKERSQLELKVREFYKGKFTVIEEEDLAMQSERERQNGKSQDNEQWAPVLPLVDSKAQQQIRRRIVLEKLQKVLPAVLDPLKIPLGDVYSELRNLVKTFR